MQGGAGGQELLAFKAGRLIATAKGGKKWQCEADTRKGKLVLNRGADGGVHLFWKLRPSNQVVEDLLVFPDGQTFSKVDTGSSEDRVYLLQFANSSRRFFFWMQEPKADGDAELCSKLNEYMSNPAAGLSGAGGDEQAALMQLLQQFQGGAGSAGGQLDVGDLSNALSEMNASAGNAAQAAGESKDSDESKSDGPGPTAAATAAAASSPTAAPADAPSSPVGVGGGGGGQLTAADLERAFAGVQSMVQAQRPTPPLEMVFNSSTMREVLVDDEDARKELTSMLPEELQSTSELYDTLTGPHLYSTLSELSQALFQGDSFNSIMANFGLNPMDGAEQLQRGDAIGALLTAMQARADRERTEAAADDSMYD